MRHTHGDCEQQDMAEVVQTAGGTLPGIDAFEMALSVSGLIDVAGRGQDFPLKLQRECFAAQLPANADLLVSIEFGFETGSAYRQDWQESQASSRVTANAMACDGGLKDTNIGRIGNCLFGHK